MIYVKLMPMNRAQKVVVAASCLVVAGLVVLAAPPVIAATSWASELFAPTATATASPSATPTAAPADEVEDLPPDLPEGYVDVGNGTFIPAGGPGDCTASAWIHIGQMSASLSGDLVDQGPLDLAAGTVGLDDEGQIKTYTIAPGDALHAISDRFCIANPGAITTLNHTRAQTIQPDEVLLLRPDSSIPWVPYFSPDDAPAGYQQIPYQQAIEAMSVAAHDGDIATMRTIFDDRLSGLFPNPDDAELIAQALDVGDLDVLRQMFA